MKLEPEEQDAVGWGDDEDLVIDEGKLFRVEILFACFNEEVFYFVEVVVVVLCACRWCYC